MKKILLVALGFMLLNLSVFAQDHKSLTLLYDAPYVQGEKVVLMVNFQYGELSLRYEFRTGKENANFNISDIWKSKICISCSCDQGVKNYVVRVEEQKIVVEKKKKTRKWMEVET